MDAVGVSDYSEYLDYLEVHQDEFPALFDVILINVTGFFRDPPAWDYYAGEIVPRLLEAVGPDDPIRCGAPAAPPARRRTRWRWCSPRRWAPRPSWQRVKIYATEVDEDALNQARQASYTAKDVEAIPRDLLERYFEQGNQRFTFRKDLRRSMIFGRNDLTQDAPISRIDLLTCRNTLMYFNAETQSRILGRFHFALNSVGLPVPRQVRDAHHALGPVPAGQPQAARLREGAQAVDARPLHDARERDARPRRGADPGDPRRRVRGVQRGADRHRRGRRPRPRQRPRTVDVRPLDPPTSGGRSRTSRSPTGRSTCGRTSSSRSASAGRCR